MEWCLECWIWIGILQSGDRELSVGQNIGNGIGMASKRHTGRSAGATKAREIAGLCGLCDNHVIRLT